MEKKKIESEKVIAEVKCYNCKKPSFLTKRDMILRNIDKIPVDTFICSCCKKRNYIRNWRLPNTLDKSFFVYKYKKIN